MHKSQGFGSKPEIGDQVEYFEPVEIVAGDRLDLLGGLDFSLDALGLDLSKLLNQIIDEFDFRSPSKSLPKLLSLRDKFSEVENIKIRNEKINYLDKIIANCLGLQVRIEATKAEYFEKEDIEISLKIFNPSDKTITLKKLVYGDKQFKLSENVKKNGILSLKKNLKSTSLTIPFWLKSPTMIGAYNIEDPQKRNLPSDDPLRSGMLAISFDSHQIMVPVEAGHYSVDPTRGEVRSYVSVLKRDYHEVMADVVLVGENGKSKDNNSTARREMGLVSLNYDHFPSSKLLVPYKAYELSLAKVENPKRVAYVQGSGDQNPEILRKMGFVVEELSKQAVLSDELELESFDVFVLGIRALNVFPEIGKLKPRLQEFMEDGGVVIVQYSTVNRISKIETEIWPYDIEIGKSRVTDEKAEPKFLVPDHPVFSSYYRIDKSDFENWVQERGLYFASSWDSHYVTPVSFADSGEDDLAGGLLVSEVGNGYFVYTGLSFFRQLPAGVSGAAKLFTNLMYLSETNSKKK